MLLASPKLGRRVLQPPALSIGSARAAVVGSAVNESFAQFVRITAAFRSFVRLGEAILSAHRRSLLGGLSPVPAMAHPTASLGGREAKAASMHVNSSLPASTGVAEATA